jgi:hypothetical protein
MAVMDRNVLEDDTWRMFAFCMGVVCHVRFMFAVRMDVCSLQQMARVCVENFYENKLSLLTFISVIFI